MKIDAIILAVYAAVLALVVPDSAVNLFVFAALLGAGVTWLTGERHFYLSFRWFRTHTVQACGLTGAAVISVLFPFVLAPAFVHSTPWPIAHLPEVLVQTPVTFLWFWVFVVVGTRFRERKIDRLVERRLAERQSAGADQAEQRKE